LGPWACATISSAPSSAVFPLAEFLPVLDHLFLAGKAMPAVLFVGFLEVVQSLFLAAFAQSLLRLLIRY